MPHLSADLKPSSSQLLWIGDIYGFLVAGSLITMGTLGDRIGRRRLLLIGAASVLAAFSTSAEMLIATRALLGIAGATLAPSTLSLIRCAGVSLVTAIGLMLLLRHVRAGRRLDEPQSLEHPVQVASPIKTGRTGRSGRSGRKSGVSTPSWPVFPVFPVFPDQT